jgi:putative ABC transport system permease protein
MDTLWQDVRYAARTLRKSPVFTIIAVVCLSVGIATNTTLFSCFNALVLRPLPFPEPDELAFVSDHDPAQGPDNNWSISYLAYLDYREQSRSFAALGASSGRSLAITEGDEPERLFGNLITANLFPALGVTPQLGRNFREDEDKPGANRVVMLSDGLWQRRYSSDSSIINRVISINNIPHTVVGVMPPRFQFPNEAELWVAMAPVLGSTPRSARAVVAYGRVKPGIAVRDAAKELEGISRTLNGQYDPTSKIVGHARPLRDEFVEDEITLITTTMFGAVTLVLLIACANVANLMLTRASARQREIAVRAAIGAGRGRLVRQLLTESFMIAAVSGAIAIPLTWLGLKLIDRGIPAENPLPWYFHWGVDAPTLIYTFAIAVMTSVVFGLIPALQVSRGRLYDALREGGGRGSFGSAKKNRLRSSLVIAEVALSLVLLVGASLFTKTFLGLQSADVGFETSKVMTARFFLPGQRYDSTSSQRARVEDVLQRVRTLPNVETATVSNSIPLESCCMGSGVIIEGQPRDAGNEPSIAWIGASGNWYETFGVKLVAGRTFTDLELAGTTPVAMIDEKMAKRFWPKTTALGQRFRLTSDSSVSYEVIGVAQEMRTSGLDDTDDQDPFAVLPYMFLPARNNGLMVRVRDGNPAAVMPAIRQAIRDADPSLPVFEVNTMDKVRSLSFWQYKLFSQMFGAFGGIALLLAGIGVYGVISYGVSQRTQEIGVRVALGARGSNVFGMVLREAAWLAGIGILIGVVGAFGVTRVIASLLIGVSPTDPVSFLSVALFLTIVALLASYIPARRAMRVDPLTALRNE